MFCAPPQKGRKQLAVDLETEQTARQTCEEELTAVKKKLSEVETKLKENEEALATKTSELTNLTSINELLAKQVDLFNRSFSFLMTQKKSRINHDKILFEKCFLAEWIFVFIFH